MAIVRAKDEAGPVELDPEPRSPALLTLSSTRARERPIDRRVAREFPRACGARSGKTLARFGGIKILGPTRGASHLTPGRAQRRENDRRG